MTPRLNRRFHLIAFDWDGTLFDSTMLIVRCIQNACRDLDVAASAGAPHTGGNYTMTTVFRLGGVDQHTLGHECGTPGRRARGRLRLCADGTAAMGRPSA